MKGKRKLKLGIMSLFVSQRAAAHDVELAPVLLCLESAALGSGCGRMSPLLSGRAGEKGKEGWFWPDGRYFPSVRKACMEADYALNKRSKQEPSSWCEGMRSGTIGIARKHLDSGGSWGDLPVTEKPRCKMCLLTVNKAWGKESPSLCEEMGMSFLCTAV